MPDSFTDRMNILSAFIRKRVGHRPALIKILDNVSWLFFDKVLRMGAGLVVGVWIARFLGPEEFGLLNFALAFVGIFGTVSAMGLQGIVVRDIVRDPEGSELTLGTTAILQLMSGLAAYLLAIVTIIYLRPDDPLARSVVAILGAILLFKFSEISLYWFESQVASKYVIWIQNIVFVIFSIIKVILILNKAPLLAFAWVTFSEAVVVACALILLMGAIGLRVSHLNASMARAKELVSDSWPLIISALAISVYMKIDQLMLGQMVGDEAVGVYSAAVRVSEVWYFIPGAIVSSVFPAILQAKITSAQLYERRMQLLCSVVIWLAVIMALFNTAFNKQIISMLYGSSYAQASSVLMIHTWAGVFAAYGLARANWLIANGMQKYGLICTVSGGLTNIIMNLYLIPRYGILGAAASTLLAQFISALVVPLAFKEDRKSVLIFGRALLFRTSIRGGM